jgi:hypothetical protein
MPTWQRQQRGLPMQQGPGPAGAWGMAKSLLPSAQLVTTQCRLQHHSSTSQVCCCVVVPMPGTTPVLLYSAKPVTVQRKLQHQLSNLIHSLTCAGLLLPCCVPGAGKSQWFLPG